MITKKYKQILKIIEDTGAILLEKANKYAKYELNNHIITVSRFPSKNIFVFFYNVRTDEEKIFHSYFKTVPEQLKSFEEYINRYFQQQSQNQIDKQKPTNKSI